LIRQDPHVRWSASICRAKDLVRN